MYEIYPNGTPTQRELAELRSAYGFLVPDPHDLYAECGYLAGGIYGGQAFTYIRSTRRGTELVVVVNGLVVFHQERDCITDEMLTPAIRFLGRWAWGLGLKRMGFRIGQRFSVETGIDFIARYGFTYA